MRRRSGLNFGKQRKKFNLPLFKEILTWAGEIILIIVIAGILVSFFGVRTTVVGQAMAETLSSGDQILINKFQYVISDPKQGDVVVFLPNGNEKSHYYVRRVIAVPGDTVQIKEGAVYVNEELYMEDIEVSSIEEAGIASEPITLEKGEYFVLGDNRNNSEDSRFANIGNVRKEHIIGKVWFRIVSWKEFGFL